MKVLNLGCGDKTSDRAGVVNIDWSVMLRLRKHPLRSVLVPVLLRGERLSRYRSLPDNIVVHNLAEGIPFESASVDAVYHSHLLEHLDREIAELLLEEVARVLRPGGIHRIVVPDFELVCRNYVASLEASAADPTRQHLHDDHIAAILEQSVRRESHGTSQQAPLRRKVENLLLGDARHRGETHQWMYDRISLGAKLMAHGYREVHQMTYDTSHIPDWNAYGLDVDADGQQYRPGSLYVEAIK